MTKYTQATAYLQIKADRNYWGAKEVNGARIMKVTQNKPSKVDKDVLVIKARVTVPVDAFENLPVVEVELPLQSATGIRAEVTPA